MPEWIVFPIPAQKLGSEKFRETKYLKVLIFFGLDLEQIVLKNIFKEGQILVATFYLSTVAFEFA